LKIAKQHPVLAIFVTLLLVRTLALWGQTELIVLPDEAGYLAQARYFAGAAATPSATEFIAYSFAGTERQPLPGSDRSPYYHFGYSLLVSPAYVFFDDRATSHQAVVAINCLLTALLFPVLFYWARALGAPEQTALLAATIASLYPAYTFQAHIGWAENALPLVFSLCCLLWLRYRQTGSTSRLVLFSLCCAFAYTLHPRGIAIPIAASVIMGFVLLLEPNHRKSVASGLAIIAGGVLWSKLTATELATLMHATEQGGTLLEKASSHTSVISLPTALGQTIYLFLASLGIFAFAAVQLLRKCASYVPRQNKRPADPDPSTMLFVLLSTTLSGGASIYFASGHAEFLRFDGIMRYYLYGRYNEHLMGVFLVLGLLWLAETKSIPNATSLRRSLAALSAVIAAFCWLSRRAEAGVASIHSSSLFPWQNIAGGQNETLMLSVTLLGPLIWTWLLLELFLRYRAKALWVSGVYFALISLSLVIYINPKMQVLG